MNHVFPPVKASLLSGGLSGGLSLHPVWLCMWSSRERGSHFKVRSRGSFRLKIKQKAKFENCTATEQTREECYFIWWKARLHQRQTKFHSQSGNSYHGRRSTEHNPKTRQSWRDEKTSWKSVPVYNSAWSGEYEPWTGLESILRTSSLSGCPFVHCTIIMDHNGLVEGPIDPSLIQSIVFDCFGPAEGSKERHKKI